MHHHPSRRPLLHRFLLLPLPLCLLLLAACAKDEPPPPAPGDRLSQIFYRLDRNNDGYISRSEAEAEPRIAQRFDQIDTNRDGRISREEAAVALSRLETRRAGRDSSSTPTARTSSGRSSSATSTGTSTGTSTPPVTHSETILLDPTGQPAPPPPTSSPPANVTLEVDDEGFFVPTTP